MKILLIDLLYIGDLMFVTPFIHALKDAYPDSKIDFIVDQRFQEVVLHNPFLNKVIPVDRASFRNNPLKNLRFIHQIRRSKYDLVINLHPNERTTVFTAFSGAPARVGVAKKGLYSIFFTKVIPSQKHLHIIDEYLNFLNELDIPWKKELSYTTEIWVDQATQTAADYLWNKFGLEGKTDIIGLNPGGSWPTKRWTYSGFAGLVDILTNRDYTPVFFGGPMDMEYINNILPLIKGPQPVVLTGRLSLLQLAALTRKCTAFVSGDSGPLYIATAQKTPAVALFGPSKPEKFGPYKSKTVVISSNDDCLGCYLRQCEQHKCMKNISAAQVFKGLTDLLLLPE